MNSRMLTSLRRAIAVSLLLSISAFGQSTLNKGKSSDTQGKILAGYFEEWSIYYANYNLADLESNGSAAKLSHLFYAFANVTSAGCQIADEWADFETPYLPPVGGLPSVYPVFGNFAELQKLKVLHPNLKVMMTLGGASASNTQAFATAASTAAGRQALASSCIDMFIKGNVGEYWNGAVHLPDLFDGFVIDWEFPEAPDKANYTLLVSEFRRQLKALSTQTGKNYQLMVDGPAGPQNYVNMDLKAVSDQVDFVTVDGYNYAGSWDTVTNHASPLFDSRANPEFGEGLSIESTVDAYLRAGVPAKKFVLGVPLYGAGWKGVPKTANGLYQPSAGPADSPVGDTLDTNGVATYRTLSKVTGYTKSFDFNRIAVSLYNPADQTFWTFDDPDIAVLKMAYLNMRAPGGLGGAFVWAVKDDDANGTMVKTMASWLGR